MNLNIPELDTALEFDCYNFLQPFDEVNSFTSPASPWRPCLTNNWDINDFSFKDLDISAEFALLDDQHSTSLIQSLYEDHIEVVLDAKPHNTTVGAVGECCVDININVTDHSTTTGSGGPHQRVEQIRRVYRKKKKRSVPLELVEIQKYFDLPIHQAAKKMNVGLTVLKKRCRELNIMRWPHRKIRSLKTLINNVKELGLSNEVLMLEEHQRMLEKLPDMELSETTKKLRQACFKANYKKRRSISASAAAY